MNTLENELENELDVEWIAELNKSINDYKQFYKEVCNNIYIYYLFVSKSNELVFMKKEKSTLQDSTYKRDILSASIKNKPRECKFDNYKLLKIAKFNIDIEPQDIINSSFFKSIDNPYFTTYDDIQDIHFNDTVHFLHNINTLFILFKENIKSSIKSSIKSKTKRVTFSIPNNNKHSKTRKITI